MAIYCRNEWTVSFLVQQHRVIGNDLTNLTCEFPILIINQIVIWTTAVDSSTLLSPFCRRWLKISPSISLAVYAYCVCQIMRSNCIRCVTVTSEDRHIWTIRKLNIITVIVLELYIVKECFGIKRLFWVYLIKYDCWSRKYIWISIFCHWQHSYSFCPITITDLCCAITSWA